MTSLRTTPLAVLAAAALLPPAPMPVGAQGYAVVQPGQTATQSQSSDEKRMEWSDGGRSGSIRMRGNSDVRMNTDFTGFASIAQGGRVDIDADDGQTERSLVIRPGNGGSLEYAYEVNGKSAPFDAAGQAWLSEFLLDAYRQGFAAKERTAYLLRSQGPDGVLSEIEKISGDWQKRQYFQAMLESGDLDMSTVRRVLRLAGQTVDSGYELAELLIAVGGKYALNEQLRDEYLAAQRSIDSDYEQRRVLKSLLDSRRLTPSQVAMVLSFAKEIDSDYELAELLLQLMQQPSFDANHDAFLQAMNTLNSSYEYGRVASALLGREKRGRR